MAITFSCECGKQMQAKDEYAGRRTKCAACGRVLVIPELKPETEPAYDLGDPVLAAAVTGPERADAGAERFVIPPPQTANGNASPPMPPLPIKIQEDELPAGWPSSLPAPSVLREPPCYGFLEKYASAVRWLGIILTASLLASGLVKYLELFYNTWFYNREVESTFDKVPELVKLTFLFLVTVLVVLVVVLVPVLFAVSLIQVMVDSGRNLRAIRAELEAKRS